MAKSGFLSPVHLPFRRSGKPFHLAKLREGGKQPIRACRMVYIFGLSVFSKPDNNAGTHSRDNLLTALAHPDRDKFSEQEIC
jgi:hypothetical protein